jgi:hypothetical protein
MSSAAVVFLMNERRVVEAFRAAGATNAETARTLEALRLHDGLAVARLRDRAVIRDAGQGRFYVDLAAWRAVRRIRRRLLIVTSILILLALALYMARKSMV